MSGISWLWKAPELNPLNHKAKTVPILNPFDKYGRTFFFSTFGFMIAFLSWYAFPPLLGVTIKKDLHLSSNEIANSNIIALTATLLVRLTIGPLCDRFGPRYCFAGVLLLGSIPTALAGTVSSPAGLYAIRFFIGILGGSFVPCQVWTTGFYDKNVVGTANALTAGIGNAGGGITYFVMPAIFDSLVANQHLSAHVAWRVSFIVPFILIVAIAGFMLLLCEDTPTGSWKDRASAISSVATQNGVLVDIVNGPSYEQNHSPINSVTGGLDDKKDVKSYDAEHGQVDEVLVASSEIVRKPTIKEALEVVFSLQTLMLAAFYATSFGGELAINSILGAYYLKNFPKLGQTGTGRWAAMFGLLNVFFRPFGGIVSDFLYRRTHSVWYRKHWLVFLGVVMGAFTIAIGTVNSHSKSTMFGLIAGLALFLEAANGALFSIVPHVHPHANGIVSGVTGASGNMGGIIFSIIFRYNGTDYGKACWIIGIIMMCVNIGFVSWVNPIPKRQLSK